jgi:enoyl-CoA hydratase
MTFDTLHFEMLDNNIGLLTVSRPKALNALNSIVLKELAAFFTEAAQRKDIRALIVTGDGDKAFIAGADISEMSKLSKNEALHFARSGQLVTTLIEKFPAPVIAAVNGYALGGGCEMAMACDFILSSDRAVFGQPEVSLGLITGFGGAVRLVEFVGLPMARELIYSGRKISAEEALRVGLVNRVVPHGELLDVAKVVALEISAQSPLAVRSVKRAMNAMRSVSDLKQKLEVEAQAFSDVFESYDQKEGTQSFLERRKPVFKGE